jgi:hypothetical protein
MRSERIINTYETLNRNARKAAQPHHIALPTCTLQSSIGSGRSWLISHSRFRTNRFLENLQVITFVSNFLMNSGHAGGTIRMGVSTPNQCCRSARAIVKGKILHLPLGYSVQSAYESRSERNMDEQTIEAIGTTRVMGDINRIKTLP